MPYDPQLGMTVYDPLEAYRSGQPAAQAFSSAYENAPQRQAQILRMQEILEEQRLRQQGMRNYTSEYNNLLAKGKTPLEASVQAFVGNAHYFSKDFGKALGTFENSAIREKLGEVSNLIRQQNADTLSDRLDYDIAAKKRALDLQEKHYQDVKDIANQRFDTQMTLGVLGSKDKSAALASREKIAAQNIVSKEGIAERAEVGKQTRSEANSFAGKVKLLSSLQRAVDAAMDAGDEAGYKDALTELNAAKAFTPGHQGAATSAEKPVVEVINGVTLAYVPGSKNIHVIQGQPTKREFVAKNFATIKRDAASSAEAIKILDDAWGAIEKAGAIPNQPQTAGEVRVKVRSPDGKMFSLPARQLPQALQQGYTEVK